MTIKTTLFGAVCAFLLGTAPAFAAAPEVVPSDIGAVRTAIKQAGAKRVLVNVWATWCDPCREEMPDLIRFYRDHRDRGVKLLLVSADGVAHKDDVVKFLAQNGVDFRSYLKTGDDMEFINGLDPRWDGTLPTSLLYDDKGRLVHSWTGKVTYEALRAELDRELDGARDKRRKP